MIEDEDHPEMVRARDELALAMRKHIKGRVLDGGVALKAMGIIHDHRARWIARGVAFPQMTLFAVPRLGYLRVVRLDWDEAAIQTEVLNTTVVCPDVTPVELAEAIAVAWPGRRPEPPQRPMRTTPPGRM